MGQELLQLIYTSIASESCTPETVSGIATNAQINNAEIDVTGVLLYSSGRFIQLLEGSEDAVTTLFGKIALDPRHRDVKLLHRQTSDTRFFPFWSMGQLYFDAHNEDIAQAYQAFLDTLPGINARTDPTDTMYAYLESFVRMHGDELDMKTFKAWSSSRHSAAA